MERAYVHPAFRQFRQLDLHGVIIDILIDARTAEYLRTLGDPNLQQLISGSTEVRSTSSTTHFIDHVLWW